MKRVLLFSPLLLILAWILSCKKEYSCEGCMAKNQPPIAIAGADQFISLPTDSILLDGSASKDPDGKITQWLWTKIAGPASFVIASKSSAKTTVRNLLAGVYQFELEVTDDGGLSAKDTVMITVTTSTTINHPPVACAGPDQVIILPNNSVFLDGGCSTDPDNNIVSWSWSKIAGPSASTIVNANAAQTPVQGLVAGVYQFELKVTDAAGAFDRDTVQITVNAQAPTAAQCDNSNRPTVNAQLIPFATLSVPRDVMTAASAGNKILFAGGSDAGSGSSLSRVDIFDVVTQKWSTAELCSARVGMAAVAAGNKIFLAGGASGDGTWAVDSVDIYDASTNTWAVTHLSMPGYSIAGATVGNKVFFAGGNGGYATSGRETMIDIYDLSTNKWATALLNGPKRDGQSAVAAGGKVYIAGGETLVGPTPSWYDNWGASNEIDVYDNSTGKWSTSAMFEGKIFMGTIVVNDKIFWAGGETGNYPDIRYSCVVEIKDARTGVSSLQYLFKAPAMGVGIKPVVKDNRIAFLRSGTDRFDIYDITTNTWSIGVLPQPIPPAAAAISVNNTIYIAGGNADGTVWKLDF